MRLYPDNQHKIIIMPADAPTARPIALDSPDILAVFMANYGAGTDYGAAEFAVDEYRHTVDNPPDTLLAGVVTDEKWDVYDKKSKRVQTVSETLLDALETLVYCPGLGRLLGFEDEMDAAMRKAHDAISHAKDALYD